MKRVTEDNVKGTDSGASDVHYEIVFTKKFPTHTLVKVKLFK